MKKTEDTMEPEQIPEKKSLKQDIKETVITLVIMVALVLLILNYVGQRVSVIGDSMNFNYYDGDQLIEDKFTYHFVREPERFEVVILKPFKDDWKTHYIKRIIGLPGETIQVTDSTIYINGVAIEDPYRQDFEFDGGRAEEPITLGENEYFLMGDNRINSIDSRYSLGLVDRKQIMGRPVFRIWPFSSFGKVN